MLKFKLTAFYASLIALLIAGIFNLLPCNAEALIKPLNSTMLYGYLVGVVFLIFCLFSKLQFKIEGKKFNDYSYYGMLITCGIATGFTTLMFSECVQFTAYPDCKSGMGLTLLHWTFIHWPLYTVFTVFELLDDRYKLLPDKISKAKNFIYSITMLIGLAISLSMGAKTLGGILNTNFGFDLPAWVWAAIILSFSTVSVFLGLEKGIKRFSNFTITSLIIFMLCLIPLTKNLFSFSVEGCTGLFKDYFYNVIPRDSELQVNTVFYVVWILTWVPFTSKFLAIISRGRSLKHVILGCSLIPGALLTVLLLIGNNIGMQIGGNHAEITTKFISGSWWRLIPYVGLMVIMFGTSADSQTLTLDVLMGIKDNEIRLNIRRTMWLLTLLVFSCILIYAGKSSYMFVSDVAMLTAPLFLVLGVIYIVQLVRKVYINKEKESL